MRLLNYFLVDPVNLGIKAKLLSLMACFCSIFFMALLSKIISPWQVNPLIVASMGASAVILFFIPSSPLAQPWPFVGGQLISAVVGVTCALNITETSTAAATAVGFAILLMLIFRCLHPPAAATGLTPVISSSPIASLDYSFVVIPVAINVFSLLLLAIIINRWVMARRYPTPLPIKKDPRQHHRMSQPSHYIGFSEQDLNLALSESDVFIDMTHAELSYLLTQAEMNSFKRLKEHLICADIMITEVTTVEFGTEVEDAWKIMLQKQLKALPVIDRARRVIGMVTWNDFLNCVDLTLHGHLHDNFCNFIRRTARMDATKPEVVGLIMSTQVMTLLDTTHIVELITLMSVQGYRQIPIVNTEQRLVGMVYQANLIAALYNQQLAHKY